MYLNHPLVGDFPITLRYAEERDRDFLTAIFAEVWTEIPQKDRTAILARGYGRIDVDVIDFRNFSGPAELGGEIRLNRHNIDTNPRSAIVYRVAQEFARKVDDFTHPDIVARIKEQRGDAARRIAAILKRWGYPAKATTEFTPADDDRLRERP